MVVIPPLEASVVMPETFNDPNELPAPVAINVFAVTIPVNSASPTTYKFLLPASVVPTPTLPVTCNTVSLSVTDEIPRFKFFCLPLLYGWDISDIS